MLNTFGSFIALLMLFKYNKGHIMRLSDQANAIKLAIVHLVQTCPAQAQ